MAKARVKVGPEVFAAAYDAAQEILAGKSKTVEAQQRMAAKHGIRARTAKAYIGCFLAMRLVKTFKSKVSADGLRFMLSRIAEEGDGHC